MSNAEAELKRRRERGRVAQSAFRKRQAEAKGNLQQQNAALKDAIAAIAAEATVDDRPELKAAIRRALHLAQPDGQKSCSPTWPRANNIRLISPEEMVDESTHTYETPMNSQPIDGHVAGSNCTTDTTRGIAQEPKRQLRNETTVTESLNTCKECDAINSSLLKFIGVNSFDFASILFWHIFLKHEAQHHGQETLAQWQHRKHRLLTSAGVLLEAQGQAPGPAHRDLVMQAASLHDSDPEAWLSKVEARLDYCKRQSFSYYLAAKTGQATDTGPVEEHEWLENKANGDAPQKWLSVTCVERRIRFIVGEEVFAAIAGPVIDRWEQGKDMLTLKESTEMIDKLLDALSATLICSGNGPRWDVETFDATVKEWCLSVTTT